jgi:DNA repair exonuclease SbcCD ATPase subunit
MSANPILTWKEADERIRALEAERDALKAELAEMIGTYEAALNRVRRERNLARRERDANIQEILSLARAPLRQALKLWINAYYSEHDRAEKAEARVTAHHSGNSRNPCPVCGRAKKEAP